jgi:hypothetical protein
MAASAPPAVSQTEDPVSNVLKWILLIVAIGSFGLFAWATVLTYERAPPQPERFVTSGGATLMTGDDILAGKGGFQKADLMDFGSLYGMGSYFGQGECPEIGGIAGARCVEGQHMSRHFSSDEVTGRAQ